MMNTESNFTPFIGWHVQVHTPSNEIAGIPSDSGWRSVACRQTRELAEESMARLADMGMYYGQAQRIICIYY